MTDKATMKSKQIEKHKLQALAKVLGIPYDKSEEGFRNMVKIIECYQMVVGKNDKRLEEYKNNYNMNFISRLDVGDR